MKLIKTIKQWIFIKKDTIQDDKGLYLFQTKGIITLLVLFVIISAATAMLFISFWKKGSSEIQVPDLRNKTLLQAVQILQKDNMRYNIRMVSDQTREEKIVLKQTPQPGFITKEERIITIFINNPARENEIPNLIGKSILQAKKIIQKSQYRNSIHIGRIAYAPSKKVKAGKIISQTPIPTTRIKGKGKITILVSKGKTNSNTILPNLKRLSLKKAVTYLALNEITPAFIQKGNSSTSRILKQFPNPGTKVEKGSLVTLHISGPTKYAAFDYRLPLLLFNLDKNSKIKSNKFMIELTIDQNGSKKTVFSGVKKVDDRIFYCFSYKRSATVSLIVNGMTILTREYGNE